MSAAAVAPALEFEPIHDPQTVVRDAGHAFGMNSLMLRHSRSDRRRSPGGAQGAPWRGRLERARDQGGIAGAESVGLAPVSMMWALNVARSTMAAIRRASVDLVVFDLASRSRCKLRQRATTSDALARRDAFIDRLRSGDVTHPTAPVRRQPDPRR